MPLGLRPARGMWWQADEQRGWRREGCAWEPEVVRRLQRDRAPQTQTGDEETGRAGLRWEWQGGQRR